jgi:hypothetical protein
LQTRDSFRVRFAGNTGEPDVPRHGKSQRGTLHRQFRYSFPGAGVESVTQSRYAVHSIRAPVHPPGEVLQLSRLIKVFEIYGNEELALASMGTAAAFTVNHDASTETR